jgi:hypothetical protein
VWIFFIFWPSKIRISPTSVVVSSFFPPRCRLSFDRCRHAAALCHTSFSWSQDDLAGSASSSDNASSYRPPSRAETEALNPHNPRRPPSPDRLTPILHCYKKVISILITLSTTKSCLYFASSLAREPHHQSFTHRYCFLSPLSHTHYPST